MQIRTNSTPRISCRHAQWLLRLTGLWAVVSVIAFGGCRQRLSKEEMLASLPPELRQQLTDPTYSTPAIVAGVESPQLLSAESAGLNDGQEVIGLVIHGQPRAYPLSRLTGIVEHVVNDCIVDDSGQARPFTVTFCDLTACSRVFQAADDRVGNTLAINIAGLLEGGLALQWAGQHFKQTEDVAGLQEVPHQRLRWDQWKSLHPETLVYAGAGMAARKGPGALLPSDATVPGP